MYICVSKDDSTARYSNRNGIFCLIAKTNHRCIAYLLSSFFYLKRLDKRANFWKLRSDKALCTVTMGKKYSNEATKGSIVAEKLKQ